MINDEVNELDRISEDIKNEIRKEVTTNKLRIENILKLRRDNFAELLVNAPTIITRVKNEQNSSIFAAW